MHMLLSISLVHCKGKFTVLTFFLGLAGRYFFKHNPRFRILNKHLGKLRLLIGIVLKCFLMISFTKKPKKLCA